MVNWISENRKFEYDAQDESGRSVVHYAAEAGRLDILTVLIVDKAADINLIDNERATPLYYAAREGYTKAVKWLGSQGGTCRW